MVTYNIRKICYTKIARYYNNVAKKYSHTYSFNLMYKNISQAYDDMLRIENGLIRRNPTIPRWQNKGCFMTNTSKWYYLYKINGETITVVDVCHSRNMHESIIKLTERELRNIIKESIRKILYI